MSYDLMVFDAAAAPADHPAFLAWYENQAEWSEDHDYDDPAVTTPALRAFYLALIQQYPPMNGPHAPDDPEDEDDEARLTDYTVGRSVIYIAAAWSQSESIHAEVLRLAAEHRVGFFDASSEQGAVWLPDGKGALKIAYTG